LRADLPVVPSHGNRAPVVLVGCGLVGAILAAYQNSLAVPFVFDDPLAITANPTIRKLWPLSDVLLPPRGEGLSVEGRPVLNLTRPAHRARISNVVTDAGSRAHSWRASPAWRPTK
jgi:hypothetical protein